MRRLFLFGALLAFAQPASAACVSPLSGNDAGGVSRTFGVTLDAGTNCYGNIAIVDGTAAANKATVKAASTAPAATDPALVVSLSQNAGLGAAATPMQVSLANTGANGTPVAVSGTVAATQSGVWTVQPGNTANTTAWLINIGRWNNVLLGSPSNYGTSPGAVAVIGVNGFVTNTNADVAGQNAASPANAHLVGAQFNTTPTTIVSGNSSPLQLDAAGNLLVNIKAGAGSGGTALADGGTFTQGTTSFTPAGCEFNSAFTNLASGTAGAFQCTLDRMLSTNIGKWGGTAVSAMTNYGTSPGAVNVPAMNAFVTNALASVSDAAGGIATSTFGSPVVNHPYGFNGATWDQQYTIGNQIAVQVAQAVQVAAYASGNAIGNLMTIANAARSSAALGAGGTGGIVQNVAMNSKSVQTAAMEVWFFNANPSGSTCTDKTAFSLAAADWDKVIGVAQIPTTVTNNSGWFSGGIGSVGQSFNQAMAFDLATATSLFACAVTRGTPTFTATTDISLKFNILRN